MPEAMDAAVTPERAAVAALVELELQGSKEAVVKIISSAKLTDGSTRLTIGEL